MSGSNGEWHTCPIAECGARFRNVRSNSPYCKNCRQNIRGWSRRNAADLLAYQSALRKRADRMTNVYASTTKVEFVPRGKIVTLKQWRKSRG